MDFYIHNLDPVVFSGGPVSIHWYGVSYLVSILLCWRYGRQLAASWNIPNLTPARMDDFLVWTTVGIILGGRIGHILFYSPDEIFQVWRYLFIWERGRSFHGGLLGVIVSTLLFARKYRIALRPFADLCALIAPLGLFLGRLGNFINGELWGRPTTVPWAVIFPSVDAQPRHPSQIYEALGEGLILFGILYALSRTSLRTRQPGALLGVFLIGYALARIVIEFFREPDAHIGYIAQYFTMGQVLCLPLIAGGIWMLWPQRSHAR